MKKKEVYSEQVLLQNKELTYSEPQTESGY